MRIERLHGWEVSVAQALDIQQRLAGQVARTGDVTSPRFIGGVDISTGRAGGTAAAAVVVLSYPELIPVEIQVTRGEIGFPYVPGLLSFREAPLILAACERLSVSPDLFLFDGQGVAHPRRLGIASHLGLFLDAPTIGCAKSRLCGRHAEPGDEAGSYAELTDDGEVIGAALRTRSGVKPVYVSAGNKINLEAAIRLTFECCRGYRLPEPTRLAHLAAGGRLMVEREKDGRLRQRETAGEGRCRS